MDVVGEAVEGVGGLVGVGAVVGALAGLDHHDVLVEGLAVLAAERDRDGSGLVGAAAAPVHAGPAVPGPVLLQAGAAGVRELHGLAGLLGSAALLPLLQAGVEGLGAWSHLTNPRLLDQFALVVVVGDSGGDARSAALGALGPGRGLDDALWAVKHVDLRRWDEGGEGFGSGLDVGDELVPVGEVSFQLLGQHVFPKDLLQDVSLLAVVAHPLFAALAGDLHQSGVGAAQVRQGELLRAQRDASHRPVDACALVFTVGLEALSVLVDLAAVLAGSALRLGSADATSGSSSEAGSKVTLQSLRVVAGLRQAAVFVQLPGAHFAAAAAVQDHAHAGCALGHLHCAQRAHGGARGGGEDQVEAPEEDNSKHQHLG